MKKTPSKRNILIFSESGLLLTITMLAYLIGSFLRIHLLHGQLLIDDEWHSMAFVIDKSFLWILTHFSVPSGFTSIPVNIYNWMLLNSIGWSELWLQLPSLILGLGCLVFGPIIARPIIGKRAAVILSLFIAISPILVFYSRMSRPYSAVAFFGFISILTAARWLKNGKSHDGLAFAICGLISVYLHLFTAIIIGTIAISLLLANIWNNHHNVSCCDTTPSWKKTALLILGMSITGAILILPALWNSINNSMTGVTHQGTIHLSSWLRLATLITGTANPILATLFWFLFTIGIIHLWGNSKWLPCTIIGCFLMQFLTILLLRPNSCQVGIVLARYSIILVPACLLLVACGLQSILSLFITRNKLKPAVSWLLIFTVITTFILAGPLPRIMTAPNNFTNHGIFQHNYKALNWNHSFSSDFTPAGFSINTIIRTDELSGFYRFIRENSSKRPIVEYPMMIGDHLNPHYFYQWYHQRPVIVGYSAGISRPTPLKGGGVYGNTYIDEVLNLVTDKSKLHFHNIINMTDLSGMKMRNVEYIIFHKRFEANFSKIASPPQELPILLQKYRDESFIIYEDANITVFSLESEENIIPK